jgi:serine/threonine protein kinase/tetratricopeptide (TPR) repeat protein
MTEDLLFAAALEKATAAEREAFLREACAGDDALRRRVDRLLVAHERTNGILDQSLGSPNSMSATVHSDPGGAPGDERAGSLVAGRYRLLEMVGEGGMGTVWAAEQVQPVRRKVAVKLIKAGMDSRAVLARFEAERQALALMDHPNIAKVLDGGTTEGGRPFFVMEYVEGVPFTRYCDDARLSVAERLSLFATVCEAVQHAHTKGVIHRDLKPGNVLIAVNDGRRVPKVIDFGLAKAMNQPLTEHSVLTVQGVMIGTPLYISPEQAEVNNPDVDTRTDVYALGVILYELLTGTTPLELQRFHEAAWHEVLRLIKEEDPPRPSARLSGSDSLPGVAALRQLEPVRLTRLVRGELDWIVMKCLEKDRSRRYETANGLARDIQRYLADESVEACPPSVGYRLSKFLRRNKGPVLSLVLLLLLLAGGVVGTTVGLVQAERARRGERRAKETAEKRLAQTERGADLLGSIFEDLDPRAEEKAGRPLRAILGDRLDRAAADLEGDHVGDPLVVAGLQDRLGRTYLALGHAAKAKALFTRAAATRRASLGAGHPDTLAVMSRQGLALKNAGELNEAIALCEQVRDAQVKKLGADHDATLATLNHLATSYWKAGRLSEAGALLEQIHGALSRKRGPDHDQTLDALDNLSGVYVGLGRGTEATALAEQVRDARVKKHGVAHPRAIASLNNLAFRYQAVGKMRKALALFEEARDAIVPKLGADHPLTLIVLDNLARMYRAFGRTDEAIPLAERVRDARVMSLGAYHPDTIHTLENLALGYLAVGGPEKALPVYKQAAAGLERIGFVHGEAGRIVGGLCDCLETLGRSVEADDWRRKWLAASREKDGPESAAYAKELEDQAEALIRRDKHADAEPILRECLDIYRKTQPEAWTTYYAQSLLGEALLGQAKYAEAEPLLAQGYEGLKSRESRITPLLARHHVAEAGGRIVQLYKSWGRPEKAEQWRAKLGDPRDVKHSP